MAVKTFGRIDALINNVQTIVSGIKLEDYTLDQFALNFTTGVFSIFKRKQRMQSLLRVLAQFLLPANSFCAYWLSATTIG